MAASPLLVHIRIHTYVGQEMMNCHRQVRLACYLKLCIRVWVPGSIQLYGIFPSLLMHAHVRVCQCVCGVCVCVCVCVSLHLCMHACVSMNVCIITDCCDDKHKSSYFYRQ